MLMPHIERTIQVSYRHQVHFTEGAFDPENSLLRDVMIDGRLVVRDRRLLTADEGAIVSRATAMAHRSAERAGLPLRRGG